MVEAMQSFGLIDFKWLKLSVSAAVFLGLSGCGAAEPTDTAAGNGGNTIDSKIAAIIPYPSDPETLITFKVLGYDAQGNVVERNSGTITKGEQWRRMTQTTPLAPELVNANGETTASTSQAVQQEVCWHGSPVVLNDGAYFGGNYLCFNTLDGSRTQLDISIANPGFVMRSAYTLVGLLVWDINNTLEFKWCDASNVPGVQNYTGPLIRYLQMGSSRFGICHF